MKKILFLILCFTLLMYAQSTFAANYVVSGAGRPQVNGTYVENGTEYGKAYYQFDNAGTMYAIGWDGMRWVMGREMMRGMIMEDYQNLSTDATCPTSGWDGGMTPNPTVEMEGRSLSYSTALFTENVADDGSVANTIVVTYNNFGGDAFTGNLTDNFITDGKVTVSNVPAGLSAQIIKTAANQLTFSLTGNATNHAQNDRVYDIAVVFQNTAFTQGNAAEVSKYNIADIGILYNITFSGGSGTDVDPYLISNKADLKVLSENWGSENLWNKHYKQTTNISFETSDFQLGGDFYNNGEGWIPIGPMSNYFSGTYDGQNHTISGLFINRPQKDYQGLFGVVSEVTAKIENIGVLSVNITGYQCVGGLVGSNYNAVISNCYSIGNVTGYSNVGGLIGYAQGGSHINCYSEGNITANNQVGGLIGSVSGSISNCYSTASVNGTGTSWNYGGLAGHCSGTISKSYCSGSVTGYDRVGGLVGVYSGTGTISNSYSTGNVTRNSGTETKIGGFIGYLYSGSITNSYSTGSVSYTGYTNPTNKGFAGEVGTGTLSNCFWDTQTSMQSTTAGTATGKTTAEMKTQTTFSSWVLPHLFGKLTAQTTAAMLI